MKSLLSIKTSFAIIVFSSFFMSANLMANSCSKSDIDYYLQKGFSHQQVVMLCSAASPSTTSPSTNNTNTSSAPAPAPAPTNYTAPATTNYQTSRIRDDQVFLSTALDALNVKLTPQSLTYDAKECIEYGYENNPDLSDDACVQSRISINMAGLKVLKVSGGLFLIKDASMLVQGNIKREYLNFNSIRRQEKSAIKSLLPEQPSKIDIPVKRGIDPKQVADRIRLYSKS